VSHQRNHYKWLKNCITVFQDITLRSMVDRNQSQRSLFKVVKTADNAKTFVSVHQTTKPCHTSAHGICCKHHDTSPSSPDFSCHCSSTNATY